MSTNLATIISGPCLVQFRGATFRSKGDVKLDLSLETFDVSTDLYGLVDKRVSGQPLKVSFTPEGRWADLTVLYPYASARLGSYVTPQHVVGTINATNNTIAVTDTTLPAGTPASFGSTATMPAGLTAATLYYLSADVAGVRTVHATSSAAIAGTSPIDITSAGTGTISFVEQWPLVIHGNDGQRVTIHNAAVTKMPSLNLKSTETLFGDCEIEGFVKNGVAWSTAASLYSIDTATWSDSGFDAADILTQPYTLTWGSAPWAGISTKNGVSIDFALDLAAVEDDASGVITRRIQRVGATAKAQPMGPDLAALMTALMLQGSGATRGRSLGGTNLDLAGDGVFVRLYAAALTGGPAQWATASDRIGDLTWTATRLGGSSSPLFLLATAAP
jgi:hypothetical protein